MLPLLNITYTFLTPAVGKKVGIQSDFPTLENSEQFLEPQMESRQTEIATILT